MKICVLFRIKDELLLTNVLRSIVQGVDVGFYLQLNEAKYN